MNEIADLTDHQLDILIFIGKGLRDREIAELIGCSTSCVSNHIVKILAAIGASNRVEAAVIACKAGLL